MREFSRNVVYLKRDPFARMDEVRRACHTDETCAWCDNPGRRQVGKGLTVLYNYGTYPDSPYGIQWQKELFCSKGCMQAYHT